MGLFGRLLKPRESELLQRVRAGAKAGDVVAQRGLGAMYIEGNLLPQNYPVAAAWYAMAAAQDDEKALYVLGEMYIQGLGVIHDEGQAEELLTCAAEKGYVPAEVSLAGLLDRQRRHAEANAWWECAAKAGHVAAAYNVGCSFNEGVGAEHDPARALFWFTRAAELGHADAQFNLAKRLATGEGIDKDEIAAHAWLTVSLGQRDDADTVRLRAAVERRLAPEQIARANELAATLKQPTA
ncbi:MAG: tetratricopeptide repeat protein [Kofleriaceae bacterium]